MPKFVLLTALAAVALVAPATAQAQTPSTLTATGVAQADVKPEDRDSEASIREAISAARAKGLPLALTDAKQRAAELAAAAGVTLGALTAFSDSGPTSGFYGPYPYGSFGFNKYCGQVANFKTVRRNGRRVRVRVKGTHRVCRFPRQIYVTATVTYAIS